LGFGHSGLFRISCFEFRAFASALGDRLTARLAELTCLALLGKVQLGSARRVGQQMYKVYVLKSETAKKSYVGFTEDLSRRLKESI